MSENIPNPHDRFFRETFSRREVAEGFLRSYLPEPISAAIDWKSLEIAKDSFIKQGKQQGWILGRQEGKKEGKKEGKQEGRQELLLRLLARKFGQPSEEQRRRVEQADGETLLRWSEQVLFAETAEEALR